MSGDWIIPTGACKAILGTTLFYPCSGNDLIAPLQMFGPFINTFWFVDRGYFSPGHQDTRHYGMDGSADMQEPLLGHEPLYTLRKVTIDGPPSWDRYKRDIEPCIRSEVYQHAPTGRQITVHLRRGYGRSAFHKHIRTIGIFFYRGDSLGGGGSGNFWLKPEHLDRVIDRLVDGGLIVTDGSNSGWSGYRQLRAHHHKTFLGSPRELVESSEPFTDRAGNRFRCIGYVGERYGPTLIWQIRKRLPVSA